MLKGSSCVKRSQFVSRLDCCLKIYEALVSSIQQLFNNLQQQKPDTFLQLHYAD